MKTKQKFEALLISDRFEQIFIKALGLALTAISVIGYASVTAN